MIIIIIIIIIKALSLVDMIISRYSFTLRIEHFNHEIKGKLIESWHIHITNLTMISF